MDASVVQEIANQLGMTIDAAGEWIQSVLPAYAAVKISTQVVPIVGCIVVITLCIPLGVFTYKRIKETDDIDLIWGIAFEAIGVVVSFILLVCFVQDLIPWLVSPEGALLLEVIEKIS